MLTEPSSSVVVTPTRHTPCSDSAREGSIPGATAKPSGPICGCVSKIGREHRRGTWASAGRSQRARRRGNRMGSVGRDWRVTLMRRDKVYQPGLTCANGITDGRNSFTEKTLPRHRRGRCPQGHPPGDRYPTQDEKGWLQPHT